ncbi:MAG: GAF and ANTAR domain-containing protein [Mycobacteriales bacterium]
MADAVYTTPPHDADDPTADPGTALARQLANIAGLLLAPGGGANAADTILWLAVSTLDSCDEAGLCSDTAQPVQTAPTPLMVQLDALQTQLEQGPCYDALAGLDSLYVPDLLDEHRWPQFSPEAARLGIRSALAYRLSVKGETVGALQLYAHLPGAFNANDRAQGLIFASYAALALAQESAQAVEQSRIENLQSALSSREVIGQAQGILMERERITADQAFQLLRRSSQHLNRKLRAVAQDIVDTGAIETDTP